MDADELITRPKPTWYNNYYFRSKLEAKWAVFFDLMKIKWVYEPEQFTCDDGSQYTPDFLLSEAIFRDGLKEIGRIDLDCWGGVYKERDPGVYLEIKPLSYKTDPSYETRIISAKVDPLILLIGDPIDAVVNIHLPSFVNHNVQLYPPWDDCMVLMYCKSCGSIKIDYNEGSYYRCHKCRSDIDFIPPKVSYAAEVARNFRFQFYDPRNK